MSDSTFKVLNRCPLVAHAFSPNRAVLGAGPPGLQVKKSAYSPESETDNTPNMPYDLPYCPHVLSARHSEPQNMPLQDLRFIFKRACHVLLPNGSSPTLGIGWEWMMHRIEIDLALECYSPAYRCDKRRVRSS